MKVEMFQKEMIGIPHVKDLNNFLLLEMKN